jgi:hypothetical protein
MISNWCSRSKDGDNQQPMTLQQRCVFVANGEIQAQQVQSFLKAEGIETVLRGEPFSLMHALTVDGLGRVEVLVSETDEPRARELLASADSGHLRLSDDFGLDGSKEPSIE